MKESAIIEWTKTNYQKSAGCIGSWEGVGKNFDYLILQYEEDCEVFVPYEKFIFNGRRLPKRKIIGRVKTPDEAQQCADDYENKER